jgi:hypothetical protein
MTLTSTSRQANARARAYGPCYPMTRESLNARRYCKVIWNIFSRGYGIKFAQGEKKNSGLLLVPAWWRMV